MAKNKYLNPFLIASFFIPTIVFGNYVLNQFYIHGSVVLDVGWFTFMLTEALSWPIQNPFQDSMLLGDTFFKTHFSLFFYITSYFHKYILFFIPPPVYYAIFIGSMYGVISISVFIAGRRLLPIDSLKQIFVLFFISIVTSMNGAALGLIGFPHIEIAIPALILLFIALYFSDIKKLSYLVFIILLTLREDAGFHLSGLLMIIFISKYIFIKNSKSFDKDLFIIAILGFLYGILAIYIQKTYFPGDNAIERVYLGNPHFAHITYSFIIDKLTFFITDRKYLYIPFLFTLILAFYNKNIFMLSGFIASLPWLLLSFIAITDMPNSFSNYYAFPFIVVLSWPIFSFIIAKKLEILQDNYYKKMLLSVILITGLSIALFPNSGGNFDQKPWKNFYFNAYKNILSTENFIVYINQNKSKFGNLLFDEPMSALFIKNLSTYEYGYVNNFSTEQKVTAETIVYNSSSEPLSKPPSKETMRAIIISNQLSNIYKVKNTNIVIATKKSFALNDSIEKFNDFLIDSYDASTLPSQTGKTRGKSRFAINNKDKSGYITFGPYIKLQEGKYQFDISYISSESNKMQVGFWDVVIALPSEAKLIQKDVVYGTNSLEQHIIKNFIMPKEFSDKQIEIRTFYDGVGSLEIKSLKISKID